MSSIHDPAHGPCPHMRVLLSELVSGNLGGVMKWFTEQHASDCPRCRPALEGLYTLRTRLRTLGGPFPNANELALTPERRAAVEAAWDVADVATGESPSGTAP